jgi:hypothetical protein
MAKKKQKFPKDAVSEKEIEPEYGFIFDGFFHPDGAQRWTYTNPKDHKKTHSQEIKASGSFRATHGHDDDKEYNLELRSGEHRGYTAGGHAHHSDGSTDHFSESTYRNESHGDQSHVTEKNRYRGTKGKVFKAEGPEAKINHGSDSPVRKGSSGTVNETYEKDHFSHVQGNRVFMAEKNKVDLVKEDYAMNAGKNWDTYIKEKGKIETGSDFKLTSGAKVESTSKEDTKITSDAKVAITGKNEISLTDDTKIILKVGQSTITIESGKISIEGTEIEIKGTGSTSIDGHPVKINGGGTTTPPFQVS